MRTLRIAGLLVGGLVLALAGFWTWAQSGTVAQGDLAQVKSYEAEGAAPGDTVRVATYNIGYLSGMTNNEPVERPRSLFSENMNEAVALLDRLDADVIGLQEIDFRAQRSYDVQQLDTLAQRLGYPVAAQAVNWDVRYLPFPYGMPSVHFGRVVSGQAVLSRYPIESHDRVVLAKTSRPFVTRALYLDRLAQVVEVRIGERRVAIVNVHLEAFETETRQAQADEVRALVASLIDDGRPVLLIGDFNAVVPASLDAMSAAERQAFSGDDTMSRMLAGLNLRAALPDSAYNRGMDAVGTYPADAPSRTIDHIYYTPGSLREVNYDVTCGDETPPSDHCAVTAELVLQPASGADATASRSATRSKDLSFVAGR